MIVTRAVVVLVEEGGNLLLVWAPHLPYIKYSMSSTGVKTMSDACKDDESSKGEEMKP